MATENAGNLQSQYLDLLNKSGNEIGLTPADITIALNTLVKDNPGPEALERCQKLLKAIAGEKFPFIILVFKNKVTGNQQTSLIPDPEIIEITHNGDLVRHSFGRWRDLDTTYTPDNELIDVVKEQVEIHLTSASYSKRMIPDTVAIARTKNITHRDPPFSLSFGYPYKDAITNIGMGILASKTA